MIAGWSNAGRPRRPVRVVLRGDWAITPALAVVTCAIGLVALIGLALAAVAPAGLHRVPSPAQIPAYDVPPAESAGGVWWFDPRAAARTGSTAGEMGTWRRGPHETAWQWSALPDKAMTELIYSGLGSPPEPQWPVDPSSIHVQRVLRPNHQELGYWVWNPAVFIGSPGGSHQWMPRWQWTPAETPLLLSPTESGPKGG